jgi:hypothetical protein
MPPETEDSATQAWSPFTEVDLLTEKGEFVHRATLPRFVLPPMALLWGTRCFIHRADGSYREGFVVAVVDYPPQLVNPAPVEKA